MKPGFLLVLGDDGACNWAATSHRSAPPMTLASLDGIENYEALEGVDSDDIYNFIVDRGLRRIDLDKCFPAMARILGSLDLDQLAPKEAEQLKTFVEMFKAR